MKNWIRRLIRERAIDRALRERQEGEQALVRELAVRTFKQFFPGRKPWSGSIEAEREHDYVVSVGWNADSKPWGAEYLVVAKDLSSARLLRDDDGWQPPMRR